MPSFTNIVLSSFRNQSKAWAALGCADNLQKQSNLQLSHSICYAKVVLHTKEKNIESAEDQLKILMKLPTTPFKTILSAVTQFFNNLPETTADMTAKITEIYKLFSNRQWR